MQSVLNPGRSDCNQSVYSLNFNPHIWQCVIFVLFRSVYPFALLVKATKGNIRVLKSTYIDDGNFRTFSCVVLIIIDMLLFVK
jgi:hypothetical protein